MPLTLPLVDPKSLGNPRRGCTVPMVGNSLPLEGREPAERGKVDHALEPSREAVAVPTSPLDGSAEELSARGR